jgi:hypothetical protein
MSRSGYSECDDGSDWGLIRWRGAVASAIRGKRGQAFLKEMVQAMDALPEPRLVAEVLQEDEQEGAVCAIGSVGRARGVDMSKIDVEDRESIAAHFGISEALAAEIMYENDENAPWSLKREETPEERFQRVRAWALRHLRPETLIEEEA